MTVTLSITALDAPLGARVEGFDFSRPPDAEMVRRLGDAIDEHLLLVFANGANRPSPAEVVAFCEAFGPLRPTLANRSRLIDFPAINLVANRDVDGVEGTGGNGVITWHSDLSFEAPLVEFLWLDAVRIPSRGGTTKWVNLCAAYDALDPELKARIDDLGVRYRLRQDLDTTGYFKGGDLPLAKSTVISLVQRNGRTGRRSVWPNTGPDFDVEVVGVPKVEGQELLAELHRHATEDRFVYAHQWQEGDACLWLNTQTMHQREAIPSDEPRVLRHVNILGVTDPRQVPAA